jgi:tetratricopeptide (TPR) repeat protein
VLHQLAIALSRTGDYKAALDARTESLRASGERAEWRQFLHQAELLLRLQRPDEAREALTRAADRAPDGVAVPTLEALTRAVETADTAVLPYR